MTFIEKYMGSQKWHFSYSNFPPQNSSVWEVVLCSWRMKITQLRSRQMFTIYMHDTLCHHPLLHKAKIWYNVYKAFLFMSCRRLGRYSCYYYAHHLMNQVTCLGFRSIKSMISSFWNSSAVRSLGSRCSTDQLFLEVKVLQD